jgi:hypothetical protein
VNSRTFLPLALLLVFAAALPSAARKKDKVAYGEGLIVNIPLAEPEVARVVADIAANGIIRGTKEYNKDEFVDGAQPATSSAAFSDWKQGGQVFYKVRTGALDPRGFKDSSDIGTLAVRYVVQPQGTKNTVLRIDAVFKEDFKHVVHPSDGSVESNEYRDIQDHLDFLELMKKEDAETKAGNDRERQKLAEKPASTPPAATPTTILESSSQGPEPASAPQTPAVSSTTERPAPSVPAARPSPPEAAPTPVENPSGTTLSADTSATVQPAVESDPQTSSPPPQSAQTLEERVKQLRSEVQRVVKSPGAALKSAPFHSALNLQSLAPGTQVLIVISTPYWYGVETHEGQHGWIMRDQLEQP